MKKAVIMAGGFGTRLRPLTMGVPKPMVPVLNTPMMEHITNLLTKHNINDVVSVLYFQPEKIQNHFGDGKKFGMSMNYVLAQADYGTAGAVKNAYEYLNDRFIIISGDVLTDFDISKALEFHLEKKSMATILLTRVTMPLQYGIVMTDNDGKITRFLEKPSWGQVFSDTINTGIYILEPEVLDLIPFRQEFDFSKDLFPLMLKNGMPLYGYITEGYWRDIGNLDEYQIGQMDALMGRVNLKMNQTELVIPPSCDIALSATISGKNNFGENVVIGENTTILDCVIGNNVRIGNGCKLSGVTLWDNIKIGDFVEITDTVICDNTKIMDYAIIHENVIIAENCLIGRKVRITPNVKLWPNKHVEDGSQLFRSLVQEEKWLRELFTDARISGMSNIEMNPEFCAKLGAAYGLTLDKKSSILASRDPDPVSRIMKRALTSGISSVGIDVNDLQQVSIPQTRQELRTGKYDGGIHVRRSPRHPDYIDIIIFSEDGRDISINTTKKVERFFFGEDIKRVHYSEVGKLYYPERTNEIYVSRYIESLKIELIKKRKFKLLMDYSFGLASTIFPNILGSLNCEVLSLNNYVDGSRFHPDPSDLQGESDETGKIMRSLGYELGFRMQSGAEKISLIDERGNWIPHTRLLTLITKLFLETNKHREPYKIAISIVAPQEIEMIAKDYNVEVLRINNSHSAMMDATLEESVLFVGGLYGGFIFRDFLFASDGMFTVGKMLEMLAETGYSTSQLDEMLPKRYQHIIETPVGWDFKGTVMRKAMEHSSTMVRQLIEGVKIFEGNDSVLLLPAKEKGAFIVYGEGDDMESAIKMAEKYDALINIWKDEN